MTITDPERARETTALLRWMVLVAAVVLALVAVWFGGSDAEPARVVERAAREGVGVAGKAAERAPGAAEPDERVGVPPDEGSADSDPVEPARDRSAEVALNASFVRPDREAVVLERATLVLLHERGAPRRVEVTNESAVLVTGLAPGRYETALEADGFGHLSQTLELTALPSFVVERGGRAHEGLAYGELIYVWPEDWVAVVLRTPDGRSARALTDALGWEPKLAFVNAFRVTTRLQPPDDPTPAPADSELATFHLPPGWHDWELPGSSIGALELHAPPPMWVGLAVHGELLGWEALSPGQRAVEFRLDLDALRARFASVALRVVDAATGAPLPSARATLRADLSAHRRDELDQVAPDDQGVVRFTDVPPGRYELSVERECAVLQRRLDLEAGEQRELGTLELGAAGCVDVRVVRADGTPAGAWVELAPLVAGKGEHELYPPMLSRQTDRDGALQLSMPTAPSTVRALAYAPGRGMVPTGARSANTRLDPADPPVGRLTLVVHDPAVVFFEPASQDPERVLVLDELELVVGSTTVDPNGARHGLKLVPGAYRARRLDAGDALVGECPFVVPADDPRDELSVQLR